MGDFGPPIFMTKKIKPPIEEVAFTPVIVQDVSSNIIRARRVNSQAELDMYLARGWVKRG